MKKPSAVKLTKSKMSYLQMLLTVIYVSAYLASNIITSRQVLLPFNISSTGGLLIFPITYILSDVFSEIYGYKYSRVTCYISFAVQVVVTLIFMITIYLLPYPSYYQNAGAYITVLGNTPKILIASFAAFVFGDWANDKVFANMKKKYADTNEKFSSRAVLSSVAGECVDSAIFYPIAFLGTMPVKTLLVMMITQVILKVGYEIIVLPITNVVIRKVHKYEEEIA